MRRLIIFMILLAIFSLTTACGGATVDVQRPGASPAPSTTPISLLLPAEKETVSPEATPAPRVFSAEELLSGEEAASFVGKPVEASFDPVEVSESGMTSGTYIYDFPKADGAYANTMVAMMCLVQNSMISPSELEKGHDAKWAFEEFRTILSDKIVDCTIRGAEAFYVADNSDVHVIFGDYYILVALRKDEYDLETNIALNKEVAEFIIDKISSADVSLVPAG
ncbi:MAG: hypothetical protein VB051_02405 [Candidatus Pelethousia sp.]|nr:hypothetical protein [Candidatus Pelethousia sp.]